MNEPFFTLVSQHDDVTWFDPAEHARGPWAPDACHAGPPTGLLARASELAADDQQLVRLTVDLIRPVPHSRFGISTVVTRRGRSVTTTEMTLIDGDHKPVIVARGMHLVTIEPQAFPTVDTDPPNFADAHPGDFAVARGAHGLTGFADAVEIRYPPARTTQVGPITIWMRTPPLLGDEPGSGFQRIAPLADCGNGISSNATTGQFVFLNTDLTINVHRPPIGEWFASSSVSRWEPNGIGFSEALLFAQQGTVGRATQTLLVRPRPG